MEYADALDVSTMEWQRIAGNRILLTDVFFVIFTETQPKNNH